MATLIRAGVLIVAEADTIKADWEAIRSCPAIIPTGRKTLSTDAAGGTAAMAVDRKAKRWRTSTLRLI